MNVNTKFLKHTSANQCAKQALAKTTYKKELYTMTMQVYSAKNANLDEYLKISKCNAQHQQS